MKPIKIAVFIGTAFTYFLMPPVFAQSYIDIKQPDGYVSVYNACQEPVWIWTTWSSDNDKSHSGGRERKRKYHRLDKINVGEQFDFGGSTAVSATWPIFDNTAQKFNAKDFNPNLNSWNGLAALRIVPKLGCDNQGSNCRVGESILTLPDLVDADYDHLYYSSDLDLYKNNQIIYDTILNSNPNYNNCHNDWNCAKTALTDEFKKNIYGADTKFPQPSIESSYEASFGCLNRSTPPAGSKEYEYCQTTASQLPLINNYYDISFVDGFTIPIYVKVFQNSDETAASCTDIDGSNHLPIASAIESAMPSTIASRGNRPTLDAVCGQLGNAIVKSNFFFNQPEYDFSYYNAKIINPYDSSNNVVGCASPKARLLMAKDIEGQWSADKNTDYFLNDLHCPQNQPDCNPKSSEYDSRLIMFTCPYAQGDLANFQPNPTQNNFCTQNTSTCALNETSVNYALSDADEAKFLSVFDKNANRKDQNLPFVTLISKNLMNPAFRANNLAGQGANNLCHGQRNETTGTYPSEYPIEHTNWVQNVRAATTDVYTYTYDDAAGLKRCNSEKSSFVVVLCGDETFIDEHIPNLNRLHPR